MDMKIWIIFHLIMFCFLNVLWLFSETLEGKKNYEDQKKYADKKQHSTGETIILIAIILAIVASIIYVLLNIVLKNQNVATWIGGICGFIYVYMAFKQMIKMIFVPEHRGFLLSDIRDFIFTYMIWGLAILFIYSIKAKVDILGIIPPAFQNIAKVVLLLAWYYFNIFFALGAAYILLYYLWKLGIALTGKYNLTDKIIGIQNKTYDWWQKGEKYTGLRSIQLWEKDNTKSIIYKILMTIPMLTADAGIVAWSFFKIFFKNILVTVLAVILDPIRIAFQYAKKLWNRHENNEWIYVLAQIAGLCSYAIVFLIIQYDGYEDATKKIYEFTGTIIWIPYFIGKILNINKSPKDKETEADTEEKVEHTIPKNMVYNEDGEGEIDGKTIRQLEYEALQNAVNNSEFVNKNNNKEVRKELGRIVRESFRKCVKEFLKNNIEILAGICISIIFVCIYFTFRSSNTAQNISMLGSIVGAEGAMLSVLLSIAFMKRSNEKALDATVLPYLTIEKEKQPFENAYAFEYIKDEDTKRDFSVWRTFDFDTIREDKRKLVRNGVAYLHIKNIGIGPAMHLKMKIENFSFVLLPIDYLRPNDEIYLILNFNNPDRSFQTDIIFEYETIRGESHTQRFHANITWHLDRTNFTLFR